MFWFIIVGWFIGAGITYLIADAVIREGADEAKMLCFPLMPFWIMCFVESLFSVWCWLIEPSPGNNDNWRM